MSEEKKEGEGAVTLPKSLVTVIMTILLAGLGSGGATMIAKPADYVSTHELELALERHSAKPHAVTRSLVLEEARAQGDHAVDRSMTEVTRRMTGVEGQLAEIKALLREDREHQRERMDKMETRLLRLEQKRGGARTP